MNQTTSAQRNGAVEFRDVSKRYDDNFVIDHVSLEIHAGEFVSLLGASGSGKTTLLMMLAGFTEPSSGQILIDGERTDHIPANKRNQGVVFQSYALFPHMTVRDNLAFPLKSRGIPSARANDMIATALERVRMTGFENRLPAQLSGGQQQRIALARAIVFDPQLILMDESLSALDRKLRQEMQVEIKDLHRALGKTIIYVTHDQQEALTMSDRVVLLQDGRIAQVGTPMQIYEQPCSPYVAKFIGEANFLDGKIQGKTGDCWHVATQAGTIQAHSDKSWRDGDAVSVMLRPEALQVQSGNATPQTGLRGRVNQVSFLGDALVYRIGVAQRNFIVKSVHSRTSVPLAVGDSADITFHAQDARVFAADSA